MSSRVSPGIERRAQRHVVPHDPLDRDFARNTGRGDLVTDQPRGIPFERPLRRQPAVAGLSQNGGRGFGRALRIEGEPGQENLPGVRENGDQESLPAGGRVEPDVGRPLQAGGDEQPEIIAVAVEFTDVGGVERGDIQIAFAVPVQADAVGDADAGEFIDEIVCPSRQHILH